MSPLGLAGAPTKSISTVKEGCRLKGRSDRMSNQFFFSTGKFLSIYRANEKPFRTRILIMVNNQKK